MTKTTTKTKTQTKCLKTQHMLYFWNPDDLLIPNMMIDTSPWLSCSRRSPWFASSSHMDTDVFLDTRYDRNWCDYLDLTIVEVLMLWFFMIFRGIFMIFYGSWLAFMVFHFLNYRPSDAMFAMYRWSLASGDQLAGRRPWSASWQQHTRWSNWRQLVLIDIWSSLTDNPSEVQAFFEIIGLETFLLLSLQGFILWGLETNKYH